MLSQLNRHDFSAAIIKDKICEMTEKGHLEEAKEALARFEQAMPKDPDIDKMIVDILLKEEEYEDALYVIRQGLAERADNFDLLFRRGLAYELQKEYVTAWDGYRHAIAGVEDEKEKKILRKAIDRVKVKIESSMHSSRSRNGYAISVKGNNKPFVIQYSMDDLKARRKLLNLLIPHIDNNASSLLEIECGVGIVSRTMSFCGFNTLGLDQNASKIQGANGIDLQENIRLEQIVEQETYKNFKVRDHNVNSLFSHDIIALLPSSFSWYEERGFEEVKGIINGLTRKARSQLFLYLPAVKGQSNHELYEQFKSYLVKLDIENCYRTEIDTADESTLIVINHGKPESKTIKTPIPHGLDARLGKSNLFTVDINSCIDINQFSFGENGWQHFWAVIEEIDQNPDLYYEDTILKKFYETFKPKNRQEQWLTGTEEKLRPLCAGWPNFPWYMETAKRIIIPKTFKSPMAQIRGGNQHFGPNRDRFGREELVRIKTAFKMMKEGYLPEIYPDGYITGYFLKKGDSYRFLITEGQHRIAALAHLGYKTIRCKFDKNPCFTNIVDIERANEWPLVKRGIYKREVAEKIFEAFFNADGRKKAKQLGLI